MGLREKLAHGLDRLGLLRVLAKAPTSRDMFTVITYHRVVDLPNDYRFDRGVVDATPEQFEEQLGFLQQHFNVIGLEQLRALDDGGSLPTNAAMITFDDGYRDNHDVALPLLQRFGLPAVFFVATRFIDERRLYWWDRVNFLIGTSKVGLLELDYPVPLRFNLGMERALALGTILALIKETRGLDTERLLSDLAVALQVPWSDEIERSYVDGLIMTWDELRALHAAGMDVQSHGHSHQPLHTMRPTALAEDLRTAKTLIERELNSEVDAIAYPVGRPVSGLPAVIATAREAGYRFGFTNGSASNSAKRLAPFDIGRQAMATEMSMSMFRGVFALPALLQEV